MTDPLLREELAMKNACLVAPGLRRHRAGLVALGLACVAGCGASVSGGDCSFFSDNWDHCFSTVEPGAFADAFVDPQQATIQVGGKVTFVGGSTSLSQPAYQWKRSSDGGKTYTDIAGATASSYTLAGAQLPDDGALFLFTVQGSAGEQAHAVASLHVSSMPPVLFQDGEFLPGDWSVSALVSPTPAGPTHDEAQAATGGNPGAYRTMAHHMSTGPSSLTVFHASTSATYDPASLGAIYRVDYSEDCSQPDLATTRLLVASNLLIEQGGHKYVADGVNHCFAGGWAMPFPRTSLVAASFVLVDGPPCNAGEACPDFSATAPPLRFGYVRSSIAASGVDAGSTVHGIDNWKVAVWRR